jgi:iduronate 2-sulfatase
LCGLEIPQRIQGKDLTPVFDDPTHEVRDAAFCVNGKGFLLRDEKWAYISYREDGSGGSELFDMKNDPLQYKNLAKLPEYVSRVAEYRAKLSAKLQAVRTNDLDRKQKRKRPPAK